MSVGGDSRLILKDLASVAGLYDVTGQSDRFPKLEQIMDAPSDEDVRTLVESARGETPMESRRWNLGVSHEPSFFFLDR